MFCKQCGKQLSDEAKFCDACGTPTQDAPHNSQPVQPNITIINSNANTNTNTNVNANAGFVYIRKSKATALLLCLILGWAGAHRFYVGKTGTGLIWLCSFGLFFIGWLLDFIGILIGTFKDKNGQPLG